MKTRSTGITLIAVLYLILGLFSLAWSSIVFGVGGITLFFSSLFGQEAIAALASSGTWSGILGLVGAAVQIAVAVGLLKMAKWAWFLALLGVVITIVQGVVGIINGGFFAFICGGIGLIIPLIILFYLLKQTTREIFEVST